jgi:hypothetical protein
VKALSSSPSITKKKKKKGRLRKDKDTSKAMSLIMWLGNNFVCLKAHVLSRFHKTPRSRVENPGSTGSAPGSIDSTSTDSTTMDQKYLEKKNLSVLDTYRHFLVLIP